MFKMTALPQSHKINEMAAYRHLLSDSKNKINDEYLIVISQEETKFNSKCPGKNHCHSPNTVQLRIEYDK